ncbi:MAG: hypothetical protein WBF93_13170 [Pirellulales bacterium]
MIIVDNALKKREHQGKPIRVGLIGAGYMGRGIAHQLLTPIAGMRLVAMSNRHVTGAERILAEAGVDALVGVTSTAVLEDAIQRERMVVTDDATLLCQAENIDVLIECTGEVEFGSHVATNAIDHGKHTVLVNAELDAVVGPILKVRAERAGVVLTNTDGDEPGIAMNLLRFVDTIGYRPVMAGNIKGFYNPHRNPETQREFAQKVNQNASMITSFADGTKLSMETAILANAAGFGVAKRGMFGHRCDHVKDILRHFSVDQLLDGGIVEFVLGAEPGTGAFVVGYNDEPVKQEYMRYFKMGDGPLYVFYTPYHLPQFQVAVTVGRAALFQDAAVSPIGKPMCDVVTVAKRNLKTGEVLDGIGGFDAYGMIDNADVCQDEDLLPMSLSRGCRLARDVAQDDTICYADVILPTGRMCDELRTEQNCFFYDERKSALEQSRASTVVGIRETIR